MRVTTGNVVMRVAFKRQKVIPGSLENGNFCKREIRIMLSISLFFPRNINFYHLCVQGTEYLGRLIFMQTLMRHELYYVLSCYVCTMHPYPIYLIKISPFLLIRYYISYYNTWHAFCIHISVTIFNILTKLDSRNVENTDKIVGFHHPDETPISISYIVCSYIHCNHIANTTFHLLSICLLNIKRVEYNTNIH